MPFNFGPMELFIVLVIVLVLFGAKRVPEIGASIGKGIREFKKSMNDVDRAIRDPERDAPPADRLPPPSAEPAARRADDETRPEPKRLLN
ncbi:MAG: twin-arginine translocase TatA/TatE family subunit [Gemmatimonadota bacterium]|nr:twin-arginine translocase TatA/TatE family subunit [Gemmatimonadota bacterium]